MAKICTIRTRLNSTVTEFAHFRVNGLHTGKKLGRSKICPGPCNWGLKLAQISQLYQGKPGLQKHAEERKFMFIPHAGHSY